jgi:CBS domain containing-hemolysin-like protein
MSDSRPKKRFNFLKSVLLNRKPRSSPQNHISGALAEVILAHGEEGGDKILSNEERSIFRKMLQLGDLTVSDVMRPRSDIIAVDYEITLTELKELINKEQHTRMPVYEDSLDKLKGFVHLKDLVPAIAGDVPFDIDEVLRDIYFIPPSMRLIDLLVQMRSSGHHLAIVVDEYGGTDGLITLEDVFEALVGDIQDEHDDTVSANLLRRTATHQFEMPARLRVEDLDEAIGINLYHVLPDEDYETVGGFIFATLQRIPRTGEIIDIEDMGYFKVLEADARRIERVQMTLNFTPLIQKTS